MKVYVVFMDDWDSHEVEAAYTTRERADQHAADAFRVAFERNGRKATRKPTGYQWSEAEGNVFVERRDDGMVRVSPDFAKGVPTGWEDVPAETEREFYARWHQWRVEEIDVTE